MSENPLLKPFNTPYKSIPFSNIKEDHYLPAIEQAIKESHAKLDQLRKLSLDQVTFENTVEYLEEVDEQLDQIASIFYNLHSAESNEDLQKIAQKIAPILTRYGNDISLDPKIFERVKVCYDKRDQLTSTSEQRIFVEKSYKSFVRNGALLKENKRKRFREIDEEMAKLSLDFSENVLKSTNEYELVLENKNDLQGLPATVVESAHELAKSRGKEGKWIFTLDIPSFTPFLKYADSSELRKKIYLARAKLSSHGEFDNRENVKKITRLRAERAKLLGFQTHAQFVLEERMAQTPQKVHDFLDYLSKQAYAKAKEDINELKEFKKSITGDDDLQKWDYNYWLEKHKKAKFNIDDEVLRPYFKLENCVEGMFLVANKLYGLKFNLIKNIDIYHDEVKTFEVVDEKNGQLIGIFYMDLFPREGKRGGAWMTVYKDQGLHHKVIERPHVSIVCNFTRPTNSSPSLLTFGELTTLFHEFGHSLHGLLSDCTYRSLSGTNVYWDFVELPSQVLENWCYEKECLDLFATHYNTGEKIPAELIANIQESSKFHEAVASIRQLSFGTVDMAWHSSELIDVDDIYEFERKHLEDLELFEPVDKTSVSCAFSHIFAGGYSAGYYSYKWAEVLDADAFELFKEKGIFNPQVAKNFRDHILSKGGTAHPMELYKNFRGREPDPDALLRRSGLI